MDKIIIEDLEIFANHGVMPEENIVGQKFIISAMLLLDLSIAGQTDDLYQSVNYAQICDDISVLMRSKTHLLLETCAEHIAKHILLNYTLVQSVSIKIEKPWAPIKQHLKTVSIEITRKRSTAYLSLGSNLGDKKANLDEALKHLAYDDVIVNKVSSYHDTSPISDIKQDDYINCAAEVSTTMTAKELMVYILKIEAQLGRTRPAPINAPRIIDIDILFFGDEISSHNDIVLPHPRMHERLFVLVPLCEINPYLVHPLAKQRICDIKTELEKTQVM